jgi:sugar phosphate isomerase/epimerase
LQRVRAIGYQSVQVSGTGPIDEAELLQMARDNGLTICATHESVTTLLDAPETIIERLQKLDCQHTALGYPSGVDLASLEGVTDFARRMMPPPKSLRQRI